MSALDLTGQWHYTLDDDADFSEETYDHSGWETIAVPGNWFLSGVDHVGVMWYRHPFDYNLPEGRYATLRFDGVDYSADVYLNGVFLGHHDGCFEPFSFDVTERLRHGDNMLAVRVSSPVEHPEAWPMAKELIKGVMGQHENRPGIPWADSGQDYNTGGIWNSVTITQHGPITIDEIVIQPQLEQNPPALRISLQVNNRGPARGVFYCADLDPENFDAAFAIRQHGVPLGLPKGVTRHKFSLQLTRVQPWEPWDRGTPYLYRVWVRFLGNFAEIIAQQTVSIGIRRLEWDQNANLEINGERYAIRGTHYIPSQWLSEAVFPGVRSGKAHPFAALVSSSEQSLIEADLKAMRSANINLIRVRGHILPDAFYEAADRMGILVWQDFPLHWGYTEDLDFEDEAARQVAGMVARLNNHPSVALWCAHSDSPWQSPLLASVQGDAYDDRQNRSLDEQMVHVIHHLNPTRLSMPDSSMIDGAAPALLLVGARPTLPRMAVWESVIGVDAPLDEVVGFYRWLEKQERATLAGLAGLSPGAPGYGAVERWLFHNIWPEALAGLDADSLDVLIEQSHTRKSAELRREIEQARTSALGVLGGVMLALWNAPWPSASTGVMGYDREPSPALDVITTALQPVLPAVTDLKELHAQSSAELHVSVCNDLMTTFDESALHWSLETTEGISVVNGHRELTLPANTIATAISIPVPPLDAVPHRLNLQVESMTGEVLGRNTYEFWHEQP